jgi:hypothetical protein
MSPSRTITLAIGSIGLTVVVSFVVQLRQFGLGPDLIAGRVFGRSMAFLAPFGLEAAQTTIVAIVVLAILRPQSLRELIWVTSLLALPRFTFHFLTTTYFVPVQDFADVVMRLPRYVGVVVGATIVGIAYLKVRSYLTRRRDDDEHGAAQ